MRAAFRPETRLLYVGAEQFITVLFVGLDPAARTLTFANAGHPKPFLLRRSCGEIAVLTNKDGRNRSALGLSPRSSYSTAEITAAMTNRIALTRATSTPENRATSAFVPITTT